MNAAIVNGLARAVIANGQAPKTLFILFSPDLSACSFHLCLRSPMNVCLSINPFFPSLSINFHYGIEVEGIEEKAMP